MAATAVNHLCYLLQHVTNECIVVDAAAVVAVALTFLVHILVVHFSITSLGYVYTVLLTLAMVYGGQKMNGETLYNLVIT